MRAVDVLAGIHQRQQCAQNARLDFVGHGKAAGRHVHQRFPSIRNFPDEFHLAFVAGVSVRRLAAHFRAFLLEEKRVVEDAQAVRGEPRRDGRFTPF